MGKKLIIKGADFSAVAINKLDDKVIDFSTATVKNYNIAETNGVVKLVAPTNGNPSFYEIDCDFYDELIVTTEGGRIFIANALLPSSSKGSGTNIESYFAGPKSDSYFGTLTGDNLTLTLPSAAKYIYIRKTTSTGTDNTPTSALLRDA